MAHTETGDDTLYPTSVTVPDDDDDADVASVMVPIEALLDRTEFLRDALGVDTGLKTIDVAEEATFEAGVTFNDTVNFSASVPETGSTVVRAQVCGPPSYDVDYWDRTTVAGWQTLAGNSGGGGRQSLRFQVMIPNGAEITGVSVKVDPAGAHGALPATPFTVRLIVHGVATAVAPTEASIASVADPAATVGAYEAVHNVDLTGLSTVVDNETRAYWVVCEHETGANAIEAGLVVYGAVVTFEGGEV